MIEFANPAALWFLTLIIPIVLLYLLKRRRQDQIVPSTLLWKQALEDTQAYTPFQKLRSNLLLLLQILIVVLLTALLAQPFFPVTSTQSRQWIFVIDRSASMQAIDEDPNRFDLARNKMAELLDTIPPTDEVMLISVGAEASIVQNFTLNHDAIRSKLKVLEPEDVRGEWGPLLLILKPLMKKDQKPKLVIASDFANFPPMLKTINFDSITVGKSTENVGITRAVIEPLPDTMQEQLIFFQVKNFSNQSKKVEVQILQNKSLLDAFDITLEPMADTDKAIRVAVSLDSRFEINLAPGDSFSLDNNFTLIANPRETISVRLESDNPFLKRAVQVLPALQMSPNAPIIVSNRIQETPGLYFLSGNNKDESPIVQWNATAPQLRFIDAGLWQISNYQILELPSFSEAFIETAKGVVGYAEDKEGKRRVVLGFQVEDSNLALLAGFPIFVGNAIEWIREGLHPRRQTVTNREHTQEGEIDSGKSFVNFVDASESQLVPEKIQGVSVSEARATILRQDFSKWFLLALLAVIILEWWVFHRKEFR